jgi:hypothetical protein
MLTIPEILKELEPYTGRFPMEAMKAAVEQREAITPELLRVVDAVADNPTEYGKRDGYMLHHLAIYLLAQFREKRAYPAIVKMMNAPGETPFDLVGDTVTETLGQVFASVYDGNPELLHGLVENEAVNEFVRAAAFEALLVLEHTGQMPRAEVVEYLRSLFHGRLQRTHSYAWDSLVSAVADLPAPELMKEVRQVYAEGLVDESFSELESIEREVAAPDPSRHEHHDLITDAIGELEWWAAFHPDDEPREDDSDLDAEEDWPEEDFEFDEPVSRPAMTPSPFDDVVPEPFVREPKVGRNEPCSCGSGKKYKKCCGKV